MKKMLVILGTIIMAMGVSVTAEARTQNDKYEEMAAYLKEEFDKEINDGFEEDFEELLKDRSKEELYTTELVKVDEGIYKYVMTVTFDESGNEELKAIMLIDFYDCETIEDVDEGYYDDSSYFIFNGKRVNDDFVDAYLESFK